MPKVSIIMPSLNVASYIRECMESVVNQTLWDIEILCIDAGSTDGTNEILTEYRVKDSRIRLIPSDKKSYGYQINLGIAMARGEYVGIVETDDSIEPDMYEALYHAATEHDLDYAKAGFYTMVTPGGERYLLENFLGGPLDQVISSDYFLKGEQSPDIFIWNGIYRLSFLKKNHIQLNESPGAAFQDCGFRYWADMHLGRGMFLNRFLYRYRRDNAASSTYNPKFADFNLAECRYIRRRMEEDQITDREKWAFFARETVMMALAPYTTFREYKQPNEGLLSTLDEFRRIIMQDRERGLLLQEEMQLEKWIEMRLFTENPKAYEEYIGIKAKAQYDVYGNFIRRMAAEKQIVVFCTGKAAKFALCLMKMNQLENIVAVCDNDREKWGSSYKGYEILPPLEAIKRYPQAHYLIANRGCPQAIMDQLMDSGIGQDQISTYKLPLHGFRSTNLFMQDKDRENLDKGGR